MTQTHQSSVPTAPSLDELSGRFGDLDGAELLRVMARDVFPGRLVVVSSFGAEAAVLLSLVAEVDPGLPVLFLETGQHFDETRRYRDGLALALGLENVRIVLPGKQLTRELDSDGTLWQRDPDACCQARKVLPLQSALAPYQAWVTGRKRYQGGERNALPKLELVDGRIKINPLAGWSKAEIEEAFVRRKLPRHPLAEQGYPSIGCAPCTRAVSAEEDPRAGRWAATTKTECGIHFSADGSVRRV